jgi:plasmid stabilization system protein ParE
VAGLLRVGTRLRRFAHPTVLADFPFSGRAQSVEGVRKLVVRKYPYLVYYTVDQEADEVNILTIQHAAKERELDDT